MSWPPPYPLEAPGCHVGWEALKSPAMRECHRGSQSRSASSSLGALYTDAKVIPLATTQQVSNVEYGEARDVRRLFLVYMIALGLSPVSPKGRLRVYAGWDFVFLRYHGSWTSTTSVSSS